MSGANLILGDCLDVLRGMDAGSVDAVVCDPPYMLGFMSKPFDDPKDNIAASVSFWAEALRVAKPGTYLAAFGGTRTYHRMVCAIEDAGWQVRDCLMWVQGQGFPKAKSCLKPAWEPIVLAMKPAKRVPALPGLDQCRVGIEAGERETIDNRSGATLRQNQVYQPGVGNRDLGTRFKSHAAGRWPANLVLSHSEGCRCVGTKRVKASNGFVGWKGGPGNSLAGSVDGTLNVGPASNPHADASGHETTEAWQCEPGCPVAGLGDASRFFYCAKASRRERDLGLDSIEIIEVEIITDPLQESQSWESEARRVRLPVATGRSAPRVIAGFGIPENSASEWNTFLFGSGRTALSRTACRSTTRTATSSTTGSKTLSWLTRSLTSDCMAAANSATANGSSPAGTAEPFTPSITFTFAGTASLPGVGSVASGTQLRISVVAEKGESRVGHNAHPT